MGLDDAPGYTLRQLLKRLEQHGPRVLELCRSFFDSLDHGFHQIEIERGGKWHRLIFFRGDRKAVVCHGFEKEANKTPKREIRKAS